MGSVDGEEAARGPSSRENERIMVSVRVRPLNAKEASRNEVVDWECINDTTIVYRNNLSPERSVYPSSYTFDRVFRSNCSTRQVYEEGAKAVVLSVCSGINSSVFAYGQTSSGKTFTMSGITEFTMVDIFDYIEKHKERDFHLKFSAMEIYNESVRDLLTADNSPLRLLDDPERGTVVEKLTEETLRDWNHFQELLAVCEAQRQIGETFLNEASSRSHQILRLTIESSTREYLGKHNSSTLAATLNFVDLAGSERASQALSAGSRLKEGSHINRSLLTLGTVIRKLSKGGTGHIPFRDSKLTRILQSSLGGNARTAVICTMSPARSYVEQSRNTLLFASCAKEVTTNARVNVVMSDKALLKHLQRELARLESELTIASPSVRADATDLLRDKDFKIEELERQVNELTRQLELALSQIQDLQQGVGNGSPIIWESEDSSYPKLHVRLASEDFSSDKTAVTDHHSFNAHSPAIKTPQSPDRSSRFSYDENNSVSDFDENLPPSSPFERMFIETPSDASSSMLIQTPDVTGNYRRQVPYPFGEKRINLSEVDPYIISEETGGQTPNSVQSDAHDISEEVGDQNLDNSEMSFQQVPYKHGAQSPYFVEFDPYQVSDELGGQTADSFEVHQYHISDRVAEKALNYDDIDPHQTPDSNGEQTENHLEDYCKEVQCIESEYVQGNSSLPEKGRRSLMGYESDRCTYDEVKHENELGYMNASSLPGSREPSGEQQPPAELKNLNCVERKNSGSEENCCTSPSYVEKVKYEMQNKSEDQCDEFAVRLEDIHKKLSAMKYDADDEIPQISMAHSKLDETPVTDIEVSNYMDIAENRTSTTKTKEITKVHSMDQIQVPDIQVEDTPQKANNSIKNTKDVGLNPQDDLDSSPAWRSDSRGIQTEIISLWDACNISLIHRTHFFLLFIKGDPEDTIYLEVERRRLCCIKDTFSWGNSIDFDGRKLTPGSSRQSLHSERVMLAKLMKRRLSRQERRDLYVKWGINLSDKRRSLQLADRLWVDTIDMDHIMESANIVAKLVRFSEPRVPKEVFGLNLMTPQGRRKSFSWRAESSLLM